MSTSSRRGKQRPPLRAVNAPDSIRVPKLKTANTASLPQQTTGNAPTASVQCMGKVSAADENDLAVNQEPLNVPVKETEKPATSDASNGNSVVLTRAVTEDGPGEFVYHSFEEIFAWDWSRMQRELRQLTVHMQQSSPAAADFLRRCILRIDVLMELPSPPEEEEEEEEVVAAGTTDAQGTKFAAAKVLQQLDADSPNRAATHDGNAVEHEGNGGDDDGNKGDDCTQEYVQPMHSSPAKEVPNEPMLCSPAVADSSEPRNVTPPWLQRVDSNASVTESATAVVESSPDVRGHMFDDEADEEVKPVATTKARGAAKKQQPPKPKPKPIARRRSLRVAKSNQRFELDDEAEEEPEAEAENQAQPQPPAATISPVKTTGDTKSYFSPDEKSAHVEETAAAEPSPASSDGGLASVMNSLTLADNMASTSMHGTPCNRESARKPKVKRLRLNSTVGKTTMAAFETPNRSEEEPPSGETTTKQKRRRGKIDTQVCNTQSNVASSTAPQPVEKELVVTVGRDDVLAFAPRSASTGDLTSGAVVLMFAAAATKQLQAASPTANLQDIIDEYWQMCQVCGRGSGRCLSPTSSTSAASSSSTSTAGVVAKKKKKSVRFCSDASGVCPINDREMSTVQQVSESMSALEHFMRTLQHYRETNTTHEMLQTFVQVLSQTSRRSSDLFQQFNAVASELLGDQHSATFAADTAYGLAAELEGLSVGVQRPFHYRLTWLCSSAVRYHLRFLLDPPPPSPSVPPITGYQPQYNCRSSLHQRICLDQSGQTHEGNGSDPKPDWSLSSSVMHALWQLQTAFNRVADGFSAPSQPQDPCTTSVGAWLKEQAQKLTVEWVESSTGAEWVWRAQTLIAAEVAREFLFLVLSHDDVVAAASEKQTFSALEQNAQMLFRVEGANGGDSHLALLSNVSELMSVTCNSLCSSSDVQRLRTMLAQHHSVCGPRPAKKKLAELGLAAEDVSDIACLLVDFPYVFEYPSIVDAS